jgi:uncharacterized RDD family membrane protein YckC
MLPEIHSFFIRGEDGQEYGPVDLDELRGWVQENRAGLGTEVRIDEPDAPWHPWQNYPELIALLAEVHVTSPVPGVPGLVLAPMGRRMAAFAIDFFLAALISSPLIIYMLTALSGIPDLEERFLFTLVNPDVPTPPNVIFYGMMGNLISSALMLLYFAGFVAVHARTPGKSIFHLRVVDASGQKPHVVKAVLRAIVLILSMNIFFLPMAYAFFNPQRRALHDFIVGTYVVEA